MEKYLYFIQRWYWTERKVVGNIHSKNLKADAEWAKTDLF